MTASVALSFGPCSFQIFSCMVILSHIWRTLQYIYIYTKQTGWKLLRAVVWCGRKNHRIFEGECKDKTIVKPHRVWLNLLKCSVRPLSVSSRFPQVKKNLAHWNTPFDHYATIPGITCCESPNHAFTNRFSFVSNNKTGFVFFHGRWWPNFPSWARYRKGWTVPRGPILFDDFCWRYCMVPQKKNNNCCCKDFGDDYAPWKLWWYPREI